MAPAGARAGAALVRIGVGLPPDNLDEMDRSRRLRLAPGDNLRGRTGSSFHRCGSHCERSTPRSESRLRTGRSKPPRRLTLAWRTCSGAPEPCSADVKTVQENRSARALGRGAAGVLLDRASTAGGSVATRLGALCRPYNHYDSHEPAEAAHNRDPAAPADCVCPSEAAARARRRRRTDPPGRPSTDPVSGMHPK